MASKAQIYDPQGDLTFILTAKPPPNIGLKPEGIFSGFGSEGNSSRFSVPTPSTPSLAPPIPPSPQAASRTTISFGLVPSIPPPTEAANRTIFSFAPSTTPSVPTTEPGTFRFASSSFSGLTTSSRAESPAPPSPRFSFATNDATNDASNMVPTTIASRSPSPSLFTIPNIVEKDSTATKAANSSESEEICMLVSSRHLSLSSPVFKAMLQHRFKEGETLLKEGKVEIPLPDDDLVAFGILMNILHARNHLVPKSIDLPLLAHLAILVDKYRLHNATGIWADIWVADLRESIPRTFGTDLILWICIAWVFRLPKEFNAVILVAAKVPIENLAYALKNVPSFPDLPLPLNMTDVIKKSQLAAVQNAVSTLDDLITNLSNASGLRLTFKYTYGLPDSLCPRQDPDCESMILGTLLRSAQMQGLWPIPKASALTKAGLLKGMRALRVQSYCGKTSSNNVFDQDHSASHGVQEMISKSANTLENSPGDLKLEDFK